MGGTRGIGDSDSSSNSTIQDILQDLFLKKNVTSVPGGISQGARSVRVSTVVLGSFNVLAAFAMASIILYDSYRTSKRHKLRRKLDDDGRGLGMLMQKGRKFIKTAIHPADIFPLIIAMCSFVQGVIFIAAQGTGLTQSFLDSCVATSQVVFLAIILVPYVQAAFGMEYAIRGLRKRAFRPWGRFDVPILLVVILAMLLSTSIPTLIGTKNETCFASLSFYVWRYFIEGLIIAALSVAISTINAGVIFYRLKTVATIDQQDRIAASRMVYYQIHAAIISILLLPWFISLAVKNPTLDTGMAATAALNLHGILSAALHLFLRSNTAATAIIPRGMPGWGRRGQLRIWGPNELGFGAHLLEPVACLQSPCSVRSGAISAASEKHRPRSVESAQISANVTSSKEMEYVMRQPIIPKRPQRSPLNSPTTPEPVAVLPERSESHKRKPSSPEDVNPHRTKNEFKTLSDVPISNKIGLPPRPNVKVSAPQTSRRRYHETVYAADDLLLLPPPLRVMGASNHRRDSSTTSSATVQIGLRLSNVVDDLPETSSLMKPSLVLPSRLQTTNLVIPAKPSFHPSPLRRSATTGSFRSPREVRMKNLPPIPRGSTANAFAEVPSIVKLSPSVYSPQSITERGHLREQSLSPTTPRQGSPHSLAGESDDSWI